MAGTYTYSFEDTSVVINHPNFGVYSAYGSGIGQLTVSYSNDMTIHDVASDLTVVVSKAVRKNGTISLEILQSSDFNSWLKKFTDYITSAATSEFALATITITNFSTGDSYTCTGVSPQKIPDNNYQAEAQRRTWVLMAANIESR